MQEGVQRAQEKAARAAGGGKGGGGGGGEELGEGVRDKFAETTEKVKSAIEEAARRNMSVED